MRDIQRLFEECKIELYSIGINVEKDCKVDIKISNRNNRRYGCCKPEEPDKTTKYNVWIRKIKYVKYYRYKKYHIEISPWVMELDDEIIKNIIIYELIHCLPECDNHGDEFDKYAKFINDQLGYNIAIFENKTNQMVSTAKIKN